MDDAIEKTGAVRPRKPWRAFLLSLAVTGLGQVYNGQWKKGVAYFVGESVLALALIPAFRNVTAMYAAVVGLIAFNLFVAGEAALAARRERAYVLRPCNRGWLYLLIFGVNLVVGGVSEHVFSTYFFNTYKVASGSMLPTMLPGDMFMVEMYGEDRGAARGDIVVFEFPDDRARDFIKRVIGLPGDTVEIRDKVVSINGKPLDEPYARHTKYSNEPVRDNLGPFTLGPDSYFVMGDNREESYDSRWWGPVSRDKIRGKATYVYLPGASETGSRFDRLGLEFR